MMLGGLVDAGVDLEAIRHGVASLGLAEVQINAHEVKKHGFRAIQVTIEHPPEHAHRHLHHIVDMIQGSQLSPRQQDLAKKIFTKLGEAEAKVHGTSIQKVHFHEVGAIDSIADIVGSAIGLDLLDVEKIVASPVPTGTGSVHIAHGRCNIPAPATAELLKGIPLVELDIDAELTTPTGASILATVVDSFGPLPSFAIQNIGYGAGQKDLSEQGNLLRLIVGETEANMASDQVWVVETNLDDVPGEVIGYTTEKLWEAGALDVYTTAIQMKKNRPGVILTVLCPGPLVAKVEKILFRETTTLGVRRWPVSRHKLERKAHEVETEWGPVQGKLAWIAGQPPAFSPEFDSCSRLAGEHNLPLRDVYETARRVFDESQT